MHNSTSDWVEVQSLKLGDKFEYIKEEKLKEARVLEILPSGNRRISKLKVITEGGTRELSFYIKAKVILVKEDTQIDQRPLISKTAPTRDTRGYSID